MFERTFAAAAAGLLGALPARAYEISYGMPVVAPVARQAHHLQVLLFWVCVAIAGVVFGAMIYSILKFRTATGAVPGRTLLQSTRAEIVWTLLPVVILISMAVPAARTLIRAEDAHGAELSVKATGYAWKWRYEYLGTGVSFDSTLAADSSYARKLRSGADPGTIKDELPAVDNPLVVPVDTRVRLLLTGNEAAHSRWLPQFAVRKDAPADVVKETWLKADRVGRYPARCAEPCRGDHGFMPIVVEALSKDDFARWLAAKSEAARAAAGVASPATGTAAAL